MIAGVGSRRMASRERELGKYEDVRDVKGRDISQLDRLSVVTNVVA